MRFGPFHTKAIESLSKKGTPTIARRRRDYSKDIVVVQTTTKTKVKRKRYIKTRFGDYG